MKNIILFGQYRRNDLLLQLLAEQRLVKDMFTYQIVEIPGKGYKFRKLHPQLVTADAESALFHADQVIALEPILGEAAKLLQESNVQWYEDIITDCDSEFHYAEEIHLKFGEEWLPDVLQRLAEFWQAGYRMCLKSDQPELNTLLHLLYERDTKADICLCLDIQRGYEFDEALFDTVLKENARKKVTPDAYIDRMLDSYEKEWKRNILEISNLRTTELYLSCSRKYVILDGEQRKIYNALTAGYKKVLRKTDRRELENLNAMFTYEAWKAKQFEMLLGSHMSPNDAMTLVDIRIMKKKLSRWEFCMMEKSVWQTWLSWVLFL